MSNLTYNLIVRSANSRNYWGNVQALAIGYGIDGRLILFQTHSVMAADLSLPALDEKAWQLRSKLLQVLQGYEDGIPEPETPRWAVVPTSELENIQKKLVAIKLERGSVTYGISIGMVYRNGSSPDVTLDTRVQTAGESVVTLHGLSGIVRVKTETPLNEPFNDGAFLAVYRAINSPERAKIFLKRAFRS